MAYEAVVAKLELNACWAKLELSEALAQDADIATDEGCNGDHEALMAKLELNDDDAHDDDIEANDLLANEDVVDENDVDAKEAVVEKYELDAQDADIANGFGLSTYDDVPA